MATFTRAADDFVKAAEADIEVSTDGGSTWDEYVGYSVTISSTSTAVDTVEFKSLDARTEIVDAGGDPTESITMGIIFTKENAGSLYKLLFDKARASDKSVDIRWSRKDAATGEPRFTTSSGKCTNCPSAPFDADNTGIVRVDVTIEAASVALDSVP